MPELDNETYEKLLAGARALRERKARLTASYGGVDVVDAALREAGLENEVSFLDMSVAQVHGICDAYRDQEPR